MQTLVILKESVFKNEFLWLPANKKFDMSFPAPMYENLEHSWSMQHEKHC